MNDKKSPGKRILFFTVKLPGIYLLITAGIILDFFIQLPFLVLCTVENVFRKRI
jgi:hypothetical protein